MPICQRATFFSISSRYATKCNYYRLKCQVLSSSIYHNTLVNLSVVLVAFSLCIFFVFTLHFLPINFLYLPHFTRLKPWVFLGSKAHRINKAFAFNPNETFALCAPFFVHHSPSFSTMKRSPYETLFETFAFIHHFPPAFETFALLICETLLKRSATKKTHTLTLYFYNVVV